MVLRELVCPLHVLAYAMPKNGLRLVKRNLQNKEHLKGVCTEIDVAFFRQLIQVNCTDIHFTQKFQRNNLPFSFYGSFCWR